jgi:hypothetical protein
LFDSEPGDVSRAALLPIPGAKPRVVNVLLYPRRIPLTPVKAQLA